MLLPSWSTNAVCLAFLCLASPTYAGDCKTVAGHLYCGKIINDAPSKWVARYTLNPNEGDDSPGNSKDNPAYGYCQIWNWEEVFNNPDRVTCTQRSLPAGATRGGTKGADVDAFCFTNTDYFIDFGSTYRKRITKGQWTQFSDLSTVTCSGAGSIPTCTN
jgi:hypothetical protein